MDTWIWQRDLTLVKWKNWNSPPNDMTTNCSVMLKGWDYRSDGKWNSDVCGDVKRLEISLICERGKGPDLTLL